ncbi:MAG TPA: phosphatase PAP2 family protein [Flavobacteriales bacterium]|nr:phosphatase PAP2 family protein [Flavobacteriales bacterium]HMR28683.1 phosphatase PAP2 family protein [Flavobacteriales bacterium]
MEIEARILQALNGPFATGDTAALHWLTDSAAWVAYGLPACLLLFGWLRKHPDSTRRALVILASAGIAALVVNVLKFTIDRPRPFDVLPFVTKLAGGGGGSFPSGHTSDAFAATLAITLLLRRWWVALPMFVWALAVGWSRMALGVHYPSDVIVGAVIGALAALVTYYYCAPRWLMATGTKQFQGPSGTSMADDGRDPYTDNRTRI